MYIICVLLPGLLRHGAEDRKTAPGRLTQKGSASGPGLYFVTAMSSSDARAALSEMLQGQQPIQMLSKEEGLGTVARPEAAQLKTLLDEESRALRKAQADFHLLDSFYDVHGFICDPEGLAFEKCFKLNGDWKYKIGGRFFRDHSGGWKAQVGWIVRLETRIAGKGEDSKDQTFDAKIQLIPTPEEARRALLLWVQNREFLKELAAIPPDTCRALQARETSERLRADPIHARQDYYVIDGWIFSVENRVFQRYFPGSILEGRFELGRRGEWRARSAFFAQR